MPKHVAILHIIHIKLQLVIFEFTSLISLLSFTYNNDMSHVTIQHPKRTETDLDLESSPLKWPVVKLTETRSGTSEPNTTQSVTIQVFNEMALSTLVPFVLVF
jgi:hypothetical protein